MKNISEMLDSEIVDEINFINTLSSVTEMTRAQNNNDLRAEMLFNEAEKRGLFSPPDDIPFEEEFPY